MIDIHTHILPGIDDGARDIEESLEMANIAVEDGITAVVATPHVMTGVFDNKKDDIIRAVNNFNEILKENKIPLTVMPGAEVHLEPDLPQRMEKGELLSLNDSRYLLVELPGSFIPDYTAQLLYELQLQGITPIIAHPERNAGFIHNTFRLQELVQKGAMAQVSSGSITGFFGSRVKKAAIHMVQEGMIQLLASDAHSSQGRVPVLSTAFKSVKQQFGKEFACQLVYENPQNFFADRKNIVPKIKRSRWVERISSLFSRDIL